MVHSRPVSMRKLKLSVKSILFNIFTLIKACLIIKNRSYPVAMEIKDYN